MLLLEIQKWQNTEARVHFAKCLIFQIIWQDKNVSLLFAVVRVHLAEQNDLFWHTRPIGWRLSMAGLDYPTPICMLVAFFIHWVG